MTEQRAKVVAVLRESLSILGEAEVPADLRAAALPEVMAFVATSGGSTRIAPVDETGNAGSVGKQPSLARLAQKLGVSAETLGAIFYLEEGELQLAVPSRKIAHTKKEGTAEVAVLVATARQGTGLDETTTSTAEIRKWVQELRRYDAKHFSDHLHSADHLLTIVGKGVQRRVRVKWNEPEQLRDLILRVAGRD